MNWSPMPLKNTLFDAVRRRHHRALWEKDWATLDRTTRLIRWIAKRDSAKARHHVCI